MRKWYLFILLIWFIMIPQVATANGTTYYQDSVYPSGHVLPLEEGIVRIDSEQLIIDVQKASEEHFFDMNNPRLKGRITVTYEMVNETASDLVVPVAFPQPGETEFWNITLDGDELPLKGEITMNQDEISGENRHLQWVHPRTNETYEFQGFDVLTENPSLLTKTFDILLKAGEKQKLTIEYDAFFGMDEKHSLHPVYRLDYLLHPASYWSDFQDLHLEITVPKKASVYINLPLKKEGDTFEGDFAELPVENLVVFVSPSSGFFVDLFNSRKGAILFLFVLFITVFILIRNIKFMYRMWINISLIILFAIIAYDILKHKILGYPFDFFQIILFLLFLLLLVWNGVRTSKKMNRNG